MERLKNEIKVDNNTTRKSEHRIENINNCNMFRLFKDKLLNILSNLHVSRF